MAFHVKFGMMEKDLTTMTSLPVLSPSVDTIHKTQIPSQFTILWDNANDSTPDVAAPAAPHVPNLLCLVGYFRTRPSCDATESEPLVGHTITMNGFHDVTAEMKVPQGIAASSPKDIIP